MAYPYNFIVRGPRTDSGGRPLEGRVLEICEEVRVRTERLSQESGHAIRTLPDGTRISAFYLKSGGMPRYIVRITAREQRIETEIDAYNTFYFWGAERPPGDPSTHYIRGYRLQFNRARKTLKICREFANDGNQVIQPYLSYWLSYRCGSLEYYSPFVGTNLFTGEEEKLRYKHGLASSENDFYNSELSGLDEFGAIEGNQTTPIFNVTQKPQIAAVTSFLEHSPAPRELNPITTSFAVSRSFIEVNGDYIYLKPITTIYAAGVWKAAVPSGYTVDFQPLMTGPVLANYLGLYVFSDKILTNAFQIEYTQPEPGATFIFAFPLPDLISHTGAKKFPLSASVEIPNMGDNRGWLAGVDILGNYVLHEGLSNTVKSYTGAANKGEDIAVAEQWLPRPHFFKFALQGDDPGFWNTFGETVFDDQIRLDSYTFDTPDDQELGMYGTVRVAPLPLPDWATKVYDSNWANLVTAPYNSACIGAASVYYITTTPRWSFNKTGNKILGIAQHRIDEFYHPASVCRSSILGTNFVWDNVLPPFWMITQHSITQKISLCLSCAAS